MATQEVEIDGGVLEGGGQILRMALVLSALQGTPIRIRNIRAGRSQPGLRPQHLKGVEVARDLCGAKLWGAQIGSTEVIFHPGPMQGGKLDVDTQTAGSISLLLQVAIPCALFSKMPSSFNMRGGTNVGMAPQIDYIVVVFKRIFEKFGGSFNGTIVKRGYYPAGGGNVYLEVPQVKSLHAVTLLDEGQVTRVWGSAFVAGNLPVREAHNMAKIACSQLQQNLGNVPVDVIGYKEKPEHAGSNGSGINLFAETSTGCIYGASSLGERRLNSPVVAEAAVAELIKEIQSHGCVDSHAQDQVILLMALANGVSQIKCGPLTLHTKTAIYIAEKLTNVQFKVDENSDGTTTISCKGTGFTSDKTSPMDM